MSSKIFGFYLESGLLLKNLSDVLLLCSEKYCTMDITESKIEFSKIDKSFTENECKVLIKLDSTYLTPYYFTSPISISIHVKYFNRLCKTLKKKDKVSLWVHKDSSLHLEIKEEIGGMPKVEQKEMPVTILYDCKTSDFLETDSYFLNNSFTVSPTLIQGIRKSIGTKASPVELKLSGDKYLEFNSTWSGAGPLKTILGEKTEPYSTIVISAGVIGILSKLSQLCNKLKFYQMKEDVSLNILKITGILDTPCYLGETCVLIKETTKKF